MPCVGLKLFNFDVMNDRLKLNTLSAVKCIASCIYYFKMHGFLIHSYLKIKIRLRLFPGLAAWEPILLNAFELVRGLLGLDKKVPLFARPARVDIL